MKPRVTKSSHDDWLEEVVDQNEKRVYRVLERIYKGQSPFQNIEVVRLANQGVTLILDGYARVFEIDEFLYHEALIHPSLHIHNNPCRVLLIGDGDGGGIRELLKYNDLAEIDWVEIDEEVVRVCQSHLPSFPQHLEKETRINTYWMDGFKFIQQKKEQYDCIYISVTEQLDGNVSQPFYTTEVLTYVKNLLKPGGYCVQSAGITTPGMEKKYTEVLKNHQKVFPFVRSYSVGLPSFGLAWGFCISRSQEFDEWTPKIDMTELKYYDQNSHRTMFLIPNYLEKSFNS